MRLQKPFLTVGLLLWACIFSITQANAEIVENHLQNWEVLTLRTPISPDRKLQLYMEVQPRVGDNSQMLLVRPALGYQITKRLSLWQGYAWAPVLQPMFRNENRIFQQALYETKFKKLSISNRTRLEERWIENTDGTAVRARNAIRLSYPLSRSGKWAIVTSDELFVNFNSVENGPVAGFDQNRVFAGISRKLHEHVTMEFGYLNQLINRHSMSNRMNHVLLLGLNINMH